VPVPLFQQAVVGRERKKGVADAVRIVSLLPSATEIVCELGLGEQLVGVSHECDYPPYARSLPKLTRALIPPAASSREIDAMVRERLKARRALYSLEVPTLECLRPDLIVTQALCEVCAVADDEVKAAACRLPVSPKVVNLEPTCLSDVIECLSVVADAAGVAERADEAMARLNARIAAVECRTATVTDRPRVVLLEWIDPPFCAGHWSPELVRLAGGIEMIGREGQPSRRIDWHEIVAANPDVMFIACCGFDAERTRQDLPLLLAQPGFQSSSCIRSGNIFWVDGSAYFNRPGPRLVDSLEILAHSLHPTLHPLPPGLPAAHKLDSHCPAWRHTIGPVEW
jgi:iron complex transport system substrate-binding protein